MKKRLVIATILGALSVILGFFLDDKDVRNWSQDELKLLKSLSLENLPPVPNDPSNTHANDEGAAQLGHALYFDVRTSRNGSVSCASCHKPEKYFTDGLKLAVGTNVGPRHTPSLIGISYSPWFYWDGRKDSQWSQALAPIEARHEHNSSRLKIAQLIASDETYRSNYEKVFGALPPIPASPTNASPLGDEESLKGWDSLTNIQRTSVTKVFTNVGKALAAYQRKLIPGQSRFDFYINELNEEGLKSSTHLTPDEVAGLELFIGQAQCVSCHNGPLLTNHEFHNTGVLTISGQLPAMGRYDGIRQAREDPFNCLSALSDAAEDDCLELTFAQDSNDLVGAQKTPTLRNVAETAPYMHGGQIENLLEVVKHYNQAPTSLLSHNEAKPLDLKISQITQLESLMHAFTAPLATEPRWLRPPNSAYSGSANTQTTPP